MLVGEPGDAYADAAPALGVELGGGGQLGRAPIGDGQDVLLAQDGPRPDDAGTVAQLHSGHPRGVPPLDADGVDGGAQHLGVARHQGDVDPVGCGERDGQRVVGL